MASSLQTALHASSPFLGQMVSVNSILRHSPLRRYRPTKALTRRIGLARAATGGRSPTSHGRCWRLGTKH